MFVVSGGKSLLPGLFGVSNLTVDFQGRFMVRCKSYFFVEPDKLKEAEEFLRSKIDGVPKTVVVSGSGLAFFADRITASAIISFEEIPWYPMTTVLGHPGKLIIGSAGKVPVIAVLGRTHFYEGKSISEIVFPVQLFSRLGIKNLIMTNAAGGANPTLRPGDFVILNGYINFTQIEMFPDVASPFSVSLVKVANETANELSIKVHQGVYCWTTGPSYETPAEISLIQKLGGDVVGMSTIPEALMAAHLGMNVLGVSVVTNLAAGLSKKVLTHEDIQETADIIKKPFSDLIENIIKKIG